MALTQLTKIDGRGINTTSDYRVGILTAIKFVGPFDGTGGNFAGVVTATDGNFSGNVTIGGTLTYEDVTNIDAVGIITAQKDIHVGAGVSVVGIVTAATFKGDGDFVDIDVDGHTNLDNVSIAGVTTASDNIIIPDNKKLILGTQSGRQLEIFHNTSGSSNHRIQSTSSTNHLNIIAPTIAPSADLFAFRNFAGNQNVFRVDADNSTKLYFNGNEKLTTENTGVNITGIVTATSADINGDIDVDGHTNLDNVSIAGVTTCARIDTNTINVSAHSDIRFASGNWSGNTTKIQNHNNYLYIVGPSNGFQFRIGATDLWLMDSISNDGNFWPTVDSGRDIGKSNRRIRNLYATTLYGDGSNLTGIVSDKIFEGNTEVETIDTGSDGLVRIKTEGVERLRITNNGNIGVGNFSSINPARKVHLHEASANTAIYATFTNGTTGSAANNGFTLGIDSAQAAILNNYSSTDIKILCNGSERLRIDNAGRLSLGVSASPGSYPVASQARQVQAEFKGGISGNAHHHGSLALNCTNNNANLYIVRSQNIQTSGVALGSVVFNGYDGTDFHCGARITVSRDATGGNNNIPCRFEFLTTADGESQPTERVRITSAGVLKLTGQSSSFETAGFTHHTNNNLYIRGGTTGLVMQSVDGNESWVVQNDYVSASTSGSERLRITSGGNVNIGGDYTQTTYTMKVTGSFAATTKSFVIDHPTKENHSLRYACLEGPENSVYVRGKTSDSVIKLPDYWKGLVHEDSITVNVTPIGNHKVWVEAINNNSVTIGSDGSEYFYTVFAERKDVDKLEVEVAK